MPIDIEKICKLLPSTIAGRLECLDNWYRGIAVYSEEGVFLGRSGPLISKDTYLKLLDAPELEINE